MQVEIEGVGSEKKEIEIHKTRNVADLMTQVKKWIDVKLPKYMEVEGFFLTHRGSILKESDLLFDCDIDKDTQVFVTLEFKPSAQIQSIPVAPRHNPIKDLQYPLPPKEGYYISPSFEDLKKMTRE